MYTDSKEGTCSATYKDGLYKSACGRIYRPDERHLFGEKVSTVQLAKGDKVFPVGVYINQDSVLLVYGLCSGPNKDVFGVGSVSFQFPKDYLLTASADDIEKMLEEVLSRKSVIPETTIKQGQTVDQVVAALGPPQQKLKINNKEIYLYKDLKVTFLDGAVSSFEQSSDKGDPEKP